MQELPVDMVDDEGKGRDPHAYGKRLRASSPEVYVLGHGKVVVEDQYQDDRIHYDQQQRDERVR